MSFICLFTMANAQKIIGTWGNPPLVNTSEGLPSLMPTDKDGDNYVVTHKITFRQDNTCQHQLIFNYPTADKYMFKLIYTIPGTYKSMYDEDLETDYLADTTSFEMVIKVNEEFRDELDSSAEEQQTLAAQKEKMEKKSLQLQEWLPSYFTNVVEEKRFRISFHVENSLMVIPRSADGRYYLHYERMDEEDL